jgi:hypothetical protein
MYIVNIHNLAFLHGGVVPESVREPVDLTSTRTTRHFPPWR